MLFPCTACGVCCRLADLLNGQEGAPPTDSRGVCVHLGDDNRCSIYEERPRLCRVAELKPVDMDFATYMELNADVCNALQVMFDIDASFRVRFSVDPSSDGTG